MKRAATHRSAAPETGNSLEHAWYAGAPWLFLLLPFGYLFQAVVALRRWAYRAGLLPSYPVAVPVIVIGNITVGGTGKTPLVAWVVKFLQQRGYRPGIIARGYGGNARTWPQQVREDSDPAVVGDEAVMLARHCGCPIAVGPDRVAAARALVEHSDCDLIVSDDGLQHYGLRRDLEIVVIDGVRRFGNGFCLPAGPLREPRGRLRSVDLTVVNGIGGRLEYPMKMVLGAAHSLQQPDSQQPLSRFDRQTVHGVAGLGNPERFFAGLRQAGMQLIEHRFPDHHPFRPEDLVFDDDYPVLMTEKDAVKCRRFAEPHHWYVSAEAELDSRFATQLEKAVAAITPQPEP